MKNVTLSLLGIALILVGFCISVALETIEVISLISGVIICIVAAVKSAKNDE